MKINPVFALIAFAISALAGYGFFAWNGGEPYQALIAIGGCLTIFLPLAGLIALASDGYGSVGNIRALSVVFLLEAAWYQSPNFFTGIPPQQSWQTRPV